MTHTIEIPFPDELLRLVDEKARRTGLDRDEYIRVVLAKDVTGEPSVAEILLPFRTQVADSGINDEALDRLFVEARNESLKDRKPDSR